MKMELGLRPKFSLLFVRIIILWDFVADLNFFCHKAMQIQHLPTNLVKINQFLHLPTSVV